MKNFIPILITCICMLICSIPIKAQALDDTQIIMVSINGQEREYSIPVNAEVRFVANTEAAEPYAYVSVEQPYEIVSLGEADTSERSYSTIYDKYFGEARLEFPDCQTTDPPTNDEWEWNIEPMPRLVSMNTNADIRYPIDRSQDNDDALHESSPVFVFVPLERKELRYMKRVMKAYHRFATKDTAPPKWRS
jgi:hypothetical protein